MGSTDTQNMIETLQQDINAYQKEIESASAKNKPEEIPGYERKIDEKNRQISSLQQKLQGELAEEKKEATEEAYEEGKDDGRFKLF